MNGRKQTKLTRAKDATRDWKCLEESKASSHELKMRPEIGNEWEKANQAHMSNRCNQGLKMNGRKQTKLT